MKLFFETHADVQRFTQALEAVKDIAGVEHGECGVSHHAEEPPTFYIQWKQTTEEQARMLLTIKAMQEVDQAMLAPPAAEAGAITPRQEFLRDVAITAAEGGINYWSTFTRYRWSAATPPDTNNMLPFPEWTIKDSEGDGFKETTITAETLEWGIKKIIDPNIEDEALHLHKTYRKQIAAASAMNDAGDIDANLADYIVQVGMFGEIVYG